MSLLSYIERLRTMPLKEKRQIAATWTIVVVSIIFIVWIVLTLGRLGSFGQPPPNTLPSITDPSQPALTPPY